MDEQTTSITTTLLVESLRDPANRRAWATFDRRYRPIAEGVGRRLGLSEDQAAEAAQEAIARFVEAARDGRYERGRGRLRSFLAGIVRNVARERRRDRARSPIRRGDSALGGPASVDPDAIDLDEAWEREQERAIMLAALDELQRTTQAEPRTMRAFELVALRCLPAAAVAAECGMRADEVHRVKHRFTARLRAIVERETAAYAEAP